jgi:uncharacterized membrane protein HdeD (DUF308 family)
MLQDWLSLSWKALVVRGVIGVLFGIAAMVWPLNTAIGLAILWGVWALLDSVGLFGQAFDSGVGGSTRIVLVLMGIIALVAAFFAIFSPAVAAETLTWILGIWLIIRGVMELVGALTSTVSAPRWLLLAGAALDLLLGILFAANPGKGAVAIAFVLGLVAFAWGLVFLATGLLVRSQLKHQSPPTDRPATAV